MARDIGRQLTDWRRSTIQSRGAPVGKGIEQPIQFGRLVQLVLKYLRANSQQPDYVRARTSA
jgi:hypothetical protein